MLLFLSVSASADCVNLVNVDDWRARKSCGEANGGDWSKCADKLLPACNTNKCGCLDGRSLPGLDFVRDPIKNTWEPVENIPAKVAEDEKRAIAVQEEAILKQAQQELLQEKINQIKQRGK